MSQATDFFLESGIALQQLDISFASRSHFRDLRLQDGHLAFQTLNVLLCSLAYGPLSQTIVGTLPFQLLSRE